MKIYLADTEPLKEQERFMRLLLRVPERRQKKVLRMMDEANRRQSLGAGILLSVALSERGYTEEQVKIGPYGKPYLEGEERFFFNLSHSESRVMCAVAESPVGCDVQQIRVFPEYRKIAKRFFAPEETAEIEKIQDENTGQELFFRYWTLKESYIKATGKGFSMPLDRFTICLKENGSAVLSGTEAERTSFFELPLKDGYCYVSCLLGKAVAEPPEIRWIDFREE